MVLSGVVAQDDGAMKNQTLFCSLVASAGLAVVLVVSSLNAAVEEVPVAPGRPAAVCGPVVLATGCTPLGKGVCTACTKCSSCGHCSKGGKCTVCEKPKKKVK